METRPEDLKRFAETRVNQIWPHLAKGLEHKSTLMKSGMRDFETRFVHALIAIQEKIEVERAGSEAFGLEVATTTVTRFNLEQAAKQGGGCEPRVQNHDRIQVGALRTPPHRLGLVDTRSPDESGLGKLRQTFSPGDQQSKSVSQIGSQRYKGFTSMVHFPSGDPQTRVARKV